MGALARKYDVNWFVRFLNIANEEDQAQGSSVTDAYKQIAWVNISVGKIATNFARAPFELSENETPVTSGLVYDLFRDVNPYMSRFQLWEATVSWLETRGEAFWLFPPDAVGIPTQIFVPSPSNMHEKIGTDNNISMWNYETDKVKIPFLPDQLIHFKLWNPWNPYRGINPLVALDVELSEDYLSGISNLNMIRNGSVPEGVLSSEQRIDEAQAKQIKETWLANHKGANKAHTVSVLGMGTTYQRIENTPAEMEYFIMKKWGRETILAKYGVPAVLASITDSPASLSGDDTKEQLATFWNQTEIPLMTLVEEKLETDFFGRFHLTMKGKFNLSEIAELQPDKEKELKAAREDVKVGIITINEERERRGLHPVPWGDVAWFPLGLVQAGTIRSLPGEPPKQFTAELIKTPIKFFERPKGPLEFMPKKRAPEYTDLVKDLHWKEVINTWEQIEKGYQAQLEAWMFAQRSYLLTLVATGPVGSTMAAETDDAGYWAGQNAKLEEFSMPWFRRAVQSTEEHIRALFGVTKAFEIEEDWSIFDTRAVQLLDERISKITQITKTLRDQAKKAMQSAISEGMTNGEAAEVLRDKYNIAQNRAPTIARTEIGGVLADSRIETYKSFNFEKHEWLDSRDGDVREEHLIDGEVTIIGENFTNGMRWPYDDTAPVGLIINCFPGDTAVSSKMLGATRMLYKGLMKVIVTARGNKLTVTPNHPILTGTGWKFAASLNDRDYLLSYAGDIKSLPRSRAPVNDDQIHTSIKDAFDSLHRHAAFVISESDFYGDGQFGHGYIDTVAVDRMLRADVKSEFVEGEREFFFANAYSPSSGSSLPPSPNISGGLSTAGRPSRGALALDERSVSIDSLPLECLSFGPAANVNAPALESRKQSATSDPRLNAQLLEADTGFVLLDKILYVRDVAFSGHVYDLQDKDGWIIAENIICGNCRCLTVPIDEEGDE